MRKLKTLIFISSLSFTVLVSCKKKNTEVLPDVVADFELSKTEILVGENISFTNTSTGDPTIFQWTFEGGNPATSENESEQVIYNASGTYSVTLKASNAEKSDEEIKQNIVSVYDKIAALYESNDTVIVRGQEVIFTNISLGNIDSYNWTFEGGTPQSSIDENPAIQYFDLGSFDVSLSVNGFGDGSTFLAEDHIVVLDSVEADFTSNSGSFTLEEGMQLQFEEASTGNPANFIWTFEGGDPATSTDADPLVTYSTSGLYDVTLIVNHEADADTLVMTDLVDVREALEAKFTSDVTSIAEGQTVTFTDESLGSPTSWLWEFEGGTPSISTDQNPTVTYNSVGTYDVKLVVANGFGTKEILKSNYVEVNGIVAHFMFDSDLTDETGFGDWSYTNLSNPNPTYELDRSGNPSPSASLYHVNEFIASGADRMISNEASVSVWVKTTAAGGVFYSLLDKFDGGIDYGFILAMSSGKMYFRGRDKSGIFRDSGPSASSVNDGNWHHVVGIMTANSTWQVWIDGVKEAEQINNFNILDTPNNIQMTLGSSQTSAIDYVGSYDDLKIYNRVLTQAEVQALFNE